MFAINEIGLRLEQKHPINAACSENGLFAAFAARTRLGLCAERNLF